jgi:hypothetical protein
MPVESARRARLYPMNIRAFLVLIGGPVDHLLPRAPEDSAPAAPRPAYDPGMPALVEVPYPRHHRHRMIRSICARFGRGPAVRGTALWHRMVFSEHLVPVPAPFPAYDRMYHDDPDMPTLAEAVYRPRPPRFLLLQ